MPNLTFTLSPFVPFTKIASSDVNTYFSDIKTLLNTTKLDSTNVQQYGLTRDRLAQTSADHVLINNGSGTMSSEAQLAITRGGTGQSFSLSGQTGKSITVNAGETAFSLATPTVDRLTQTPAADVATLTAGNSITANDAVCLDLDNNSNYRVFRCDASAANRRRNFLGFAVSTATVTPQIQTTTAAGALVASNVVSYTINGRSYSTTFSASSDATMTAIATQMATDPDIQSAVVTGSSPYRIITLTGIGAIPINLSTPVVTLGGSQTTFTNNTTQNPVGSAVQIRNFGDMGSFSSLTVGAFYYLSSITPGAITASPTDTNPIQVGQALSTTILFVNTNIGQYQFTTSASLIRSNGGSAGETLANALNDSEHFNFTSWSAGASDTSNKMSLQSSDTGFSGFLQSIDGVSSASSFLLETRKYNKTAWSAGTARSTGRNAGGSGLLSNIMYIGNGTTAAGPAQSTDQVDSYTGSSWTAGVATLGTSCSFVMSFLQGGKVHWVAGVTNAGGVPDRHDTYNGSAASTAAVSGLTSYSSGGSISASSNGISGSTTGAGNTKQWNGSSWSSAIAIGYSPVNVSSANADNGQASAYNSATTVAYINGGTSAATTSIASTSKFNGSTWSADTASANSRAGAQAGVL